MCRLVFDERHAVDIVADQGPEPPQGFLLLNRLGALSPENDAGLMRRLLTANLFARNRNDAFVGLNSELNELTLLCRHDCSAMDSA